MTLSSSGFWALLLGACVEITIIVILEDHPLFYLACWLFTMTTLYRITVIKTVDQSALEKHRTSHMLFTV